MTRNVLLPQFQTALGTVVHATPMAEALRRVMPGARIVVAAAGMAAEVWEGNPYVDQVVRVVSPLADFRGSVRGLRAAGMFDGEASTTLLTTGNERTKITLAAVLAGRVWRDRRVGFAVRRELLQVPLVYDGALSQIANNLRLLSAAGLGGGGNEVGSGGGEGVSAPEPFLNARVHRAFAEEVLGPRTRLRIALATQTSVTQRKSWRAERWMELAGALRTRWDAELVFVGTEGERAAIDFLRERIGFATVSVAGRTTISQLAAVLGACDVGVMLDTGPLHVARGVGLRAVVIAPAWSPVHEWLPVGKAGYRILKNRDFMPPAPMDYVIDEVGVGEVLGAVAGLVGDGRSSD